MNGLTLTKEDAVRNFTKGRTESLGSLSFWELQELERELSSMTVKKELHIPGGDKCDSKRKKIISQFRSIGRTAQDAKDWAEKYGVFGIKKPFNEYDLKELNQLARNAEQMKLDAIKSVNKKFH